MATEIKCILLLLYPAIFMLAGCTYGLIYTDITEPLVINMHETKRADDASSGKTKSLKEPITAPGIRVEWSSIAIGDIAKKNHFENVSYADLRTKSFLGGIFRSESVRVYGVKSEDPEQQQDR